MRQKHQTHSQRGLNNTFLERLEHLKLISSKSMKTIYYKLVA